MQIGGLAIKKLSSLLFWAGSATGAPSAHSNSGSSGLSFNIQLKGCDRQARVNMTADDSRQALEFVDVAVVGGGPGGLATAAAVLSALGKHMRVKVYESSASYTLQGSAVGLSANAQHALEAIHPDLLKRFEKHGLPINGIRRYNLEGDFVGMASDNTRDLATLHAKYGKQIMLLGWHEIRTLLFDYLPEGVVEFGKQFLRYEEDDQGVTLHFDKRQPSVRAKLLVGADGYFSRVRKQCLNDGPPMFTGCVMWRARIATPKGLTDNSAASWRAPDSPIMSGPFAMLIPMGTLDDTKHKPWAWLLGAPMSALKEAGVEFDPTIRGLKAIQGEVQSGSALENALKIFKMMPAQLMDIVENTDPSTVTQHGLYMRPLTDPSIHPFVAPKLNPNPGKTAADPGKTPVDKPASPGTPPQEEEARSALEGLAGKSAPQEEKAKSASEGSQPAAPDIALAQAANALTLETAGVEDKQPGQLNQNNDVTKASAASNSESVPASKTSTATSGAQNLATGTSADKPSPTGKTSSDAVCSAAAGESEGDAKVLDQLWGRGKVTLLGDAAHATIPNGQGLALALEDAAVLGWHLKRLGLGQAALRSYEMERPERVKVIHIRGVDNASYEERERLLFKPTFKPLWCQQEQDPAITTCITDFYP